MLVLLGLLNPDKMFVAWLSKLIAVENSTGLPPSSLSAMFTNNHSRRFGGKRVASFSCVVTSPQRTILVGIMKFDAA